ncbi:MAG TPA: Imm49 family immunity protein [Steroidobacteraceae bacterium]|nr:Imm49 family immunity protein [Steroidobacteraceae bacterium]
MKLADYLQAIAYDIAFWMTAFQNPDFPLGQLGEVCIEVTGKLRAAAIIALLTKADSDAFLHNLMRSARCRLQYLQRLSDAQRAGEHHQASGRVDPFLDALAAQDFATARQIAALSPREWQRGHEYEDDYCYAQILHGLIAPPGSGPGLGPFFARFESVLDGVPDARLDVTRALAARDQSAFEAAFEALIARRTAQIEADLARKRIEDPPVVAERQVYVEGIAMLRIAERLGLSTQLEYLYCPSIARVPMQSAFPGV